MDKLKMHSPDMTQQNIEKIQALFPNCVTESKGANGELKLAIDFDQLKQELSNSIVEGPQERYQLNWPGKREALLTANAPIAKTLRPCREESVNFDTTKNLFIEGDNLDALKMLQETYLGRVKTIYIDPPYNTGRDFIYDDDFSENTESYFKNSLQADSIGNRLVANMESNGRFHSDWLSMMYSRIKLAKNLLSDSGVVFISIDDEEYANLKKICDEIFGEQNFVETFVWVKKTAPNNVVVGSVHEYVLMYVKDFTKAELYLLPRDPAKDKDYKNPDNDPRGRWKPDNLTAAAKGGRSTPSLLYKIVNPNTGQEHFPPEGRMWAVNQEDMAKKIKEGTVYWGKNGDGKPMDKRFLSQTRDGTVAQTLLNDVGTNSTASKYLNKLFDGYVVFETPKPIELIERLLRISTRGNDLILDFFAGSSATAEAVIKLNNEDLGSRKFIMVQIPEPLKEGSEGFKLGCRSIADVSKARIRKIGSNYKNAKDFGFRVLKVDSSNMADVYYSPDQVTQGSLDLLVDNIKADRTDEDLLFQVLLDWGVDLTLPIRKETIQGKSVFFVDDDALLACFDLCINEALIKELATKEPLRVVFRDDGFESDAVKINAEQIFKQVSPHTEVKAI
ncbi:site-specific DNA-methyltransferase [Providencia rettgeri]|uniref:site-specific DNA-methyltransferase n=1 Tax=Providencia TaxID=586 RepID=UPI0018C598D5|nr:MULTISPECIES: site-specific DNA-methyltransferase [Providencia]MBG5975715.1 site-specific DNA-methyltransferase [Proteus mirabilis]EJD6370013.1 site-specific DNA-methyltransferase [Providencia rettgeri]EJD6374337.1 site-specific DNA-methyltransferase [Providencia rettgeri]ELR5128587.1 site-specific DNA-methyltransferase [Providencia rettgeri]ELR5136915.1 site-specific DNA-methyltransferase [Providencia rettgeri]